MSHDTSSAADLPPQGGRFSWPQLAVWLPGAVLLGAVAAWVAVLGQSYFAPLVMFPILVGVGLGAMLVGLFRVTQIGHRPTLFIGAVLAGATAVVGQHYFSYRDALRRPPPQNAEALQKLEAAFPEFLPAHGLQPPQSFSEYMRRQAAMGRPLAGQYRATGAMAWLSWGVDGLLVLLAAVAVIVPAGRQPYCNRCRSWYRTVRSGRIPPPIAWQLAEAADVQASANLVSARYRLSNCATGCGLTRLELSWEDRAGSTFLNEAWLDREHRNRAVAVLDRQEEA